MHYYPQITHDLYRTIKLTLLPDKTQKNQTALGKWQLPSAVWCFCVLSVCNATL